MEVRWWGEQHNLGFRTPGFIQRLLRTEGTRSLHWCWPNPGLAPLARPGAPSLAYLVARPRRLVMLQRLRTTPTNPSLDPRAIPKIYAELPLHPQAGMTCYEPLPPTGFLYTAAPSLPSLPVLLPGILKPPTGAGISQREVRKRSEDGPKPHTNGQAGWACPHSSLLTSALSCLPRLLVGPSGESRPHCPCPHLLSAALWGDACVVLWGTSLLLPVVCGLLISRASPPGVSEFGCEKCHLSWEKATLLLLSQCKQT